MKTSQKRMALPPMPIRIDRPACWLLAVASLSLLLEGCALTPRGLDQERRAMAAAGQELRRGAAREELPVPTSGDDWRTLLRRALIANGEVRAAWFEWKAAVERVRGASGWPNTNISLGYSYLFSDERMKTFDRMSFNAGFDSMENLAFPGKTMAAGRVALEDARAAGQRFRAAKFAVQRRVLDAWLDLAMAAETARLAGEGATLAAVAGDAADAALRAGAAQGSTLQAQVAAARSENAVADAMSEIEQARATLAALAAMDAPARIATPTRLPAARALPPDPAVLLLAVEKGPEVRGLAADRRARRDEEELARLQWIPDLNPYAMATGSIEQGVGAMLVLPTTIAEIRSGIAVARAMRGAAGSKLAQARRDQTAEVRSALVAARNAERARRLLENRILPAAGSAAVAAESGYTTGAAELGDLVESQQLLVEVRMEVAAAAIEREKQLAAVEETLGADLETFTGSGALRLFAAAAAQAEASAAPQETVQ